MDTEQTFDLPVETPAEQPEVLIEELPSFELALTQSCGDPAH